MIDRPIIVSCGDPAGIGPEVVQKAWNDLRDAVPVCMIGDPRFLPLDLPYVWLLMTLARRRAAVQLRCRS